MNRYIREKQYIVTTICRIIKIMTWIFIVFVCVYFRNSVINCLLLQYSYCSCCMQKQICLWTVLPQMLQCSVIFYISCHKLIWFGLRGFQFIQMMQKNHNRRVHYVCIKLSMYQFIVKVEMQFSQLWVPKLATIKPTWHYWT